MAEYSNCYRPVNVLLVGGLNDAMRGRSAVPPKIAVLSMEERKIQDNQFELLSRLTTYMRELNRDNVNPLTGDLMGEYSYPTYHSWGTRTKAKTSLVPEIGPKNIMENTAGIRDAQWREGDVDERVHLDDGSRLRMGKSTITYFKVLYQIIKCRASSKLAGLEIERREREGSVRDKRRRMR